MAPKPGESRFSESGRSERLFAEFDSQTAAKLVGLGIEARFDPGRLLFQDRDQSGQFYVIAAGTVALEQPAPGRAIRIQTLHEGDFLGWSALLGEGTRHFQARALTPVTVLALDGDLVRRACETDPRFGYTLMKRLMEVVTERLDVVRMQLADCRRGAV